MDKIKKSNNDADETKVILQEFDEDPFHKFNIAFALMSVIPSLVFLYIVAGRVATIGVFVGSTGLILTIAIFVSLMGLVVGYNIIRKILDKVVFYAAKARYSDSLKSKFVATVSHDLRSPIFSLSANISGMLEGVYGNISDQQKDALKLCHAIANRMGNLVSNLLDIYKIEAGMVKLNKKKCRFSELAREQIREMDIIAQKKEMELVEEFTDDNMNVSVDRGMMTEVMSNILSNAIKYTPEGGKITVRVFPSDEFVRVEVQDTAESIPEEKLQKIFDKFERLGRSDMGTGLGLAISKDIIEIHDGHIWAESYGGEGNKFIFILPKS